MTEPSISVLLVDDQRLMREGLRTLLELHPDLRVAGEAGDGIEAERQVERLRPRVVLMDLRMPRRDGIAATAGITARWQRGTPSAPAWRRPCEHLDRAVRSESADCDRRTPARPPNGVHTLQRHDERHARPARSCDRRQWSTRIRARYAPRQAGRGGT